MRRPAVLPKVIHFEGLGRCFWVQVRYGNPKAGEFYLAGDAVMAHQAPADFSSEYYIVTPTEYAVKVMKYARGDRVVLPRTQSNAPLPMPRVRRSSSAG